MAATTYLIRVIPMVFFKKKIENKFFRSFSFYVPYACLAAMTFPAMIFETNSIISGGIAMLLAIILAYKGVNMVKVSIFTCLTVYICEIILRTTPFLG